MSLRDTVWIVGIILALGVTWGMTSQRINAMEKTWTVWNKPYNYLQK